MHKKGVLYGDKSIVIDNLSTSEDKNKFYVTKFSLEFLNPAF
jgi:hypothetical protein